MPEDYKRVRIEPELLHKDVDLQSLNRRILFEMQRLATAIEENTQMMTLRLGELRLIIDRMSAIFGMVGWLKALFGKKR